ncbi:right-handed parallel beta-helix repeat-containing protein [Aureibaculum sp. A20]|uniref:Right-handed parallel beta-helix repeat-containing protein n=1 Tax=Aureibaculum flavum TaxID=2795986 RepID=A0ABS0WVD1_9FLAO|nr:right-handed parallel beta-helix repeat-containing protein [Aureibaculum flavum]MBJ2175951.1 right-handed parallel beta-helix repeat-containing protein [Aureibaculum flavum]
MTLKKSTLLRIIFSVVTVFCCVFLFLSCTDSVNENEISFYVTLEGSDSQNGTRIKSSFATLEKARNTIRELKQKGKLNKPVTVYIKGGTYQLSEPFVLTSEDSGTEEFPITYRAYENEKPIISGGLEVSEWTKTELNGCNVLVSDLSKIDGYAPFEQLWVNSHRAIQARTPNSGYLRFKFDESQIKSMTQGLKGPMDRLSYIANDEHNFDGIEEGVVVAFYKWLEYHLPFDQIDRENDEIIFSGKTMRRVETNEAYYLEGGKGMLDNPGEWYLDRQTKKLYYYPLENETEVIATIPSLINVLRMEGDARNNQYVKYIQFKELTFSHTSWVLPRDASEPGSYGQADIRMEGALQLKGAKNNLFEDCEITAIGNYGLEIGLGCSDIKVLSCDIHDLGAGGFLIGPKIRPKGKVKAEDLGKVALPPLLEDPADATSNIEIADTRIYDGGKYFHCAVGIWIGQSPDNHIHHNEIFNFYYSAISTGWTWGYGRALATGNLFEYNHIHHIGGYTNGDGSVLSDLGGIYTLGDQTGTIIRYNEFHDMFAGKYGGWAIYCDEGSRNILIENNLAYRCRHACFNQHYGKDNLVQNNIFAFADTAPIMLARAEPHTSYILRNNIILSDITPIYAGGYAYDVEKQKAIDSDSNLIWSTSGKVHGAQNRFSSRIYEPNERVLSWKEWTALGNDQNSIVADPGFKDPANGDFSLPDDSPALKIGFKPFPLGKTGPRSFE